MDDRSLGPFDQEIEPIGQRSLVANVTWPWAEDRLQHEDSFVIFDCPLFFEQQRQEGQYQSGTFEGMGRTSLSSARRSLARRGLRAVARPSGFLYIEGCLRVADRTVRVLPGDHYGFAWNSIGTNARDMEHFVKLLDFTPLEAITAATKHGGELMELDLGLVKEGYLADLILVDGDPLKDIAILQDADRITTIMKDGAFHKTPSGDRAAGSVAA